MTKAEDKNRGVLTVDIDYIPMAQAVQNAMYMLQKFADQLDIVAIEKGINRPERRKSNDRRNNV